MSNPTKVKICCIQNIAEARMALEAGASALGLVGQMPSGPGPISDAQIAEIVQQLPADTETFLLTSETTVAGIKAHHQRCGTSTIQLVDMPQPGIHAALRNELNGVQIVQVIHVQDEWAMDEAMSVAHHCDALLLDSGNPNKAIKELGGTGRTHDWEISRKIVQMVRIPVYLAGGLHAENVVEAVQLVQPYGVDLCSGVRTFDKLDALKLEAFMNSLISKNSIS